MSDITSSSTGKQFSAAPDEEKEAKAFSPNVEELRKRARKDVEEGAVTKGYPGQKEAIIKMLSGALATELVCVLRYRKHYYMAKGIDSEPIAQEFLEHSNEELTHADKLAVRIAQLGGDPDLNPSRLLERSHAEYVEAESLQDMIKENLVAERIAIDSYRAMIDFIGGSDPTTRRLLEEILEVEENHADELADLISK